MLWIYRTSAVHLVDSATKLAGFECFGQQSLRVQQFFTDVVGSKIFHVQLLLCWSYRLSTFDFRLSTFDNLFQWRFQDVRRARFLFFEGCVTAVYIQNKIVSKYTLHIHPVSCILSATQLNNVVRSITTQCICSFSHVW